MGGNINLDRTNADSPGERGERRQMVQWTNAFFAEHGLFTMVEAHEAAVVGDIKKRP